MHFKTKKPTYCRFLLLSSPYKQKKAHQCRQWSLNSSSAKWIGVCLRVTLISLYPSLSALIRDLVQLVIYYLRYPRISSLPHLTPALNIQQLPVSTFDLLWEKPQNIFVSRQTQKWILAERNVNLCVGLGYTGEGDTNRENICTEAS